MRFIFVFLSMLGGRWIGTVVVLEPAVRPVFLCALGGRWICSIAGAEDMNADLF